MGPAVVRGQLVVEVKCEEMVTQVASVRKDVVESRVMASELATMVGLSYRWNLEQLVRIYEDVDDFVL